MIDPELINIIPAIKSHASELLGLANEIASSRSGPYQDGDYLGAMADAFINKQIADLKSICILVDNDQNPSALIIARSIYENMALLQWSAFGPNTEERPRKWFANEYIARYREILAGYKIEPKIEKIIFRGVQEHGDIMLTPKAENDLLQFKSLSNDPFIRRWPDKGYREIIEELARNGYMGGNSYIIYKLLSQWLHGTPQGMGLIFQHNGNRFLQDVTICKYLGGIAIWIGTISLGNTAVLFNNHFGSNFKDRLAKSRDRFSELYPGMGSQG